LKARRNSWEKAKPKGISKLGKPFGDLLKERKERIKMRSPHKDVSGWDLHSLIVKVGDDCRQEALCMQMITHINSIFKDAKLPLRLRPFNILITSPSSGLVEVVTDTTSVDSLKKNVKNFQTLIWFFENHFGPRGSKEFQVAQTNFVQSMAAYSLVTYLLQIKDRHNGNILIDAEGYVVHIDFGFFLSNSPGGNWGFEQAPFKLTQEYVEVMDGEDSECFNTFKLLMIRGFLELRRHADKLVALASILWKGPHMPCFHTGIDSITQLRSRFYADKTEQECIQCVYTLIEESINNWRSNEYDRYQRITNGIL
jgi:phosphatidylinositol 4-kinase